MSPEPPPTDTDASAREAVLEWGGEADDDAGAPPRRRGPARLAQELLEDRRLVPLAASLGGAGLFASLVSEWQLTEVESTILGGPGGIQAIPSGISELGGWAGGYLAGVFLLVGATVLLLFGPAAGRRYARLAGLSAGGVLLAVLFALLSELDDNSLVLGRLLLIQVDNQPLQVTYGRGIWCALFGVAATTFAVYQAGRHLAPEPVRPAAAMPLAEAPAEEPVTPDTATDRGQGDWLWRRPAAAHVAQDEDGPLELTVSPANPFTPQLDDRDKLR